MFAELLLTSIGAISSANSTFQSESPPTTPVRFEFPSGSLSALAAALAADQAPAVLAREDVATDWNDPATFERWRAALESTGGTEVRTARARLALLALRQGRTDDAWTHATIAGADPSLLAALLPRFLPGIGAEDAVGIGGLAGALPDGAVLVPATPPRTKPLERGRIERRMMRVRGLRVGDAVLGLRIVVEPEGVQIDIEHQGGGAARVAVKLPVEPGFELGNEYVDWFQAEVKGVAHVVEIRPGDEEHTLYGRFAVAEHAVHFALPPAAPSSASLGGIAIRPEWGADGLARAEALARALSGRPLVIAARVEAHGAGGGPAASAGYSPITVDLRDPRTSEAKVAALCGAVERFLLR